jgi:Na+-driven multidrug efflux pump
MVAVMMCLGPSTVTRTDVLFSLGQGHGDFAKKYYHLGLICQLHVGVAFMVAFGYFKDSIILLFSDVAPVVSYLENIWPLLVMLQMLHPLYSILSTMMRVMNECEYLAWMNFVCMILNVLFVGIWLFCTDYNPAYCFIGHVLVRLTGNVWRY